MNGSSANPKEDFQLKVLFFYLLRGEKMTKEFKSIDEQINILTSRGLLFEDQEKAKINLKEKN